MAAARQNRVARILAPICSQRAHCCASSITPTHRPLTSVENTSKHGYVYPMNKAVGNLSVGDLNLRLRQQELVAEFGRFAMQADSFQKILDEACVVAAEGLNARFTKVLEYLSGEMAFVVRSGVGWSEGVVGHARVGGDLQSPAGYAFRSGKPIISNHLSREQRFRTPKLLADHNIRSAINVLIQAPDNAPFGVLEGDSTHRAEFGDHDIAFLQGLANTLAVALQTQSRQDAREALLLEKEALLRERQALLLEKDLLMQEVHHRVKNSLQMVRSVLSLQARTLTSLETKGHLEDAAARVMAIAAVHHRLHDGPSVTASDAARYLRGLLDDLRVLVPNVVGDRPMHLDVEPLTLAPDETTSLGLIVVELVTNALKYGRGCVSVALQRSAEGLEVLVSDEGDGFPHGFDPTNGRGLGMRMVAALAKPANGTAIRIDRSVPFGRIAVKLGFGASDSA